MLGSETVLHIFKAAGSSTRDALKAYARRCRLNYKTCGSKCSQSRGTYICLANGQVLSSKAKQGVKEADVIAGHLWFGMHRYLETKQYVYITCLRNPLETTVSGHLYTHAKMLQGKSPVIAAIMVKNWLQRKGIPSNFVKRLTGHIPRSVKSLDSLADKAITNLRDYFAVVGVVEKYSLFIDLVEQLLDPSGSLMPRDFWNAQKMKRENPSVVSSSKVLMILKEENATFIHEYNDTLKYDWRIYNVGIDLCMKQAKARLKVI